MHNNLKAGPLELFSSISITTLTILMVKAMVFFYKCFAAPLIKKSEKLYDFLNSELMSIATKCSG